MSISQENREKLWKLVHKASLLDCVVLQKKIKNTKSEEEFPPLAAEISAAVEKTDLRWAARPALHYPENLPILQKKDVILQHLKDHTALVVSASTGSGKSTQLAKFCLEAGLGRRGKILCVQPRRIAVTSLAKRIASELQENLGKSVDYHIRFDDKTDPKTFIRLMTDGMLLAKMQQDPYLWEYEAIILDEAHERSLNIDLLLGLLSQLRKKRPQLRIIIASATLDAEKFCSAWQAPLVHIETALYPITLHYRPPQSGEDMIWQTQNILQEIFEESREGDILIFMPCEEDIHQTMAMCQNLKTKQSVEFLPLYARLPQSEQQRIFTPSGSRKVIIATNIAETSITIDGLCYVIDSGLARISQYSSLTHLQSLPIMPISQSSANQRKGRCGRIAPGVCYRMYSEEDFNSRPEFTCPEIQRSNLSDAVLRMFSLGISDLVNFPFPDPPQKRYFHAALVNLHQLNAITEIQNPKLTRLGRILAHLPIDPRLGRILLAAAEEGCLQECLIIVAAMAGQEIRERPKEKAQTADQKHTELGHNASDFLFFLNLHNRITLLAKKSQRAVRQFCQDYFLSYRRVREWLSLIHQLTALMRKKGYQLSSIGVRSLSASLKPLSFASGYAAIHRAILYGYVHHVGHLVGVATKNKSDKPCWIYQNLQRKNLNVVRGSALYKEKYPWMMSGVILHTHDLLARMNAAVDQEWIITIAKPFLKYKPEFPVYSEKKGEATCQLRGYWGAFLLDPGKNVALIDHDPILAKELFLKNTLVSETPNQVRLKLYPFWQKNQALKEEIENLEQRLRKKNFYAGDDALYQFYQKNLPAIGGWVELDQYLRTYGDTQLCCKKEDLLVQIPDDDEKNYPLELPAGGKSWPLTYIFEPISSHDGYTISLHSCELDVLNPDEIAWGIPGQFSERIENMIRNLPKEQRIKLHPIKQICEIIVKKILRQGNFFAKLQKFCQEEFQVFIPEEYWRIADNKTPQYLRPRYALVNHMGQEVASSRILEDLKKISTPGIPESILVDLKKKLEQNPFKKWPSFPLMQPIPIEKNGQKVGVCYPVLQCEGPIVTLKLASDRNSYRDIHLAGVQALLHQRYHKEITGLKKSLESKPGPTYFSYFGGSRHFDQIFWQGAMMRHFMLDLQTEEDWTNCNQTWLQEQAKNIDKEKIIALESLATYAKLKDTLASYTEKHAHMKRFWQEQKDLLDIAAGQSAWPVMSGDCLDFLLTYIKSLEIRSQRAIANPMKDKEKSACLESIQRAIEKVLQKDREISPMMGLKNQEILLLWQQLQVKTFTPELAGHIKISVQSVQKILSDNS